MNRQMSARRLGTLAIAGTVAALVYRQRARRRSFAGQNVVITGGSRGLGLELARLWASEGARVAICARDIKELETAGQELAAKGAEVFYRECDVTSQKEVESFVKKVIKLWGSVDVLVNNAGIIQAGPVDCMVLEDYRDAMDTHFWGPIYAIDAVLPSMRKRGRGNIVNIASIGGEISVPHLLPYCASKFALVGLSEGLCAELAAAGIAVTTVCPGLMRTGSPRNALFKGQHRYEYAWFSISDSLPLLSISSRRAARQIVRACRHDRPYLAISLPAKLAIRFHGVAPRLTARMMAIANRMLPKPGGVGKHSKRGKDSFSHWSPSLLTLLNERAAKRNNERQ